MYVPVVSLAYGWVTVLTLVISLIDFECKCVLGLVTGVGNEDQAHHPALPGRRQEGRVADSSTEVSTTQMYKSVKDALDTPIEGPTGYVIPPSLVYLYLPMKMNFPCA